MTIKKIDVGGQQYQEVIENLQFSQTKLDYFNKQGWGYKDSNFIYDEKKDMCYFTGNGKRYLYSGEALPALKGFASTELTFDL